MLNEHGKKIKMAKISNKNNQSAALLVNVDSTEVMQLRQDMPEWLWIEAPEDWPFKMETKPIAQSFEAIIVFASHRTEAYALAICKHICEKQLLSELPLLVAGSRYQMALAHAVKRLSRGNFIFIPLKEDSLLKEIEKSQVKQL
jgi:hypothetical protein